jgi:hypothetical protein
MNQLAQGHIDKVKWQRWNSLVCLLTVDSLFSSFLFDREWICWGLMGGSFAVKARIREIFECEVQ